jgi:hypothetical protein
VVKNPRAGGRNPPAAAVRFEHESAGSLRDDDASRLRLAQLFVAAGDHREHEPGRGRQAGCGDLEGAGVDGIPDADGRRIIRVGRLVLEPRLDRHHDPPFLRGVCDRRPPIEEVREPDAVFGTDLHPRSERHVFTIRAGPHVVRLHESVDRHAAGEHRPDRFVPEEREAAPRGLEDARFVEPVVAGDGRPPRAGRGQHDVDLGKSP